MASTDKERGTWALVSDGLLTTYPPAAGTTGWRTKGRNVRQYRSGLFRITFTRGTSGMTSLVFRLLSADISEKDTPGSFVPLTSLPGPDTAGEDERFTLDASASFSRGVRLAPDALLSVACLALDAKGSHVKGNSVLAIEFLGSGDNPVSQTENVA